VRLERFGDSRERLARSVTAFVTDRAPACARSNSPRIPRTRAPFSVAGRSREVRPRPCQRGSSDDRHHQRLLVVGSIGTWPSPSPERAADTAKGARPGRFVRRPLPAGPRPGWAVSLHGSRPGSVRDGKDARSSPLRPLIRVLDTSHRPGTPPLWPARISKRMWSRISADGKARGDWGSLVERSVSGTSKPARGASSRR